MDCLRIERIRTVRNLRAAVFAADAERWHISSTGGQHPLWSRDGRELFYLTSVAAGAALMRAGVDRDASWTATAPTKLFEGAYFLRAGVVDRAYDISSDGCENEHDRNGPRVSHGSSRM